MRLAADSIAITIEGDVITLRASLRAAFRLERRYGGFQALAQHIMDGSLSAMLDVMRESAEAPSMVPAYLEEIAEKPLHNIIETLQLPILTHVFALAGLDDELPQDEASDQAAKISFETYHRRLFQLATGWLGWSPEVAWRATPAEILVAYEGKVEMLKAIFGGGDDKPQDAGPELTVEEKIRLAVASRPKRVISADAED